MKRSILAFVTLVTAACGGSSSGGSNATVTIVTPTANQTVTRDPSGGVTVNFSLQNFQLRTPGQCGSTANCGHIHLNIDGNACNNQSLPGYNSEADTGTSVVAHFNLCPTPTGSHTVRLELHDDQHNPVLNSSGQQIQAQVAVTVQ